LPPAYSPCIYEETTEVVSTFFPTMSNSNFIQHKQFGIVYYSSNNPQATYPFLHYNDE
jgi:hypothetical protein